MRKWCLCIIVCLLLTPLWGGITAHAQAESLVYLYNGNTQIYTNLVNRTQKSVTAVCPDYFELNLNGQAIKTREPDTAFVTAMHTQGVKVLPFLSNHWDRDKGRAGLANRAYLVSQLVKWVQDYDFDGIDIDIENLNEADRESYTDFIRLLRAQMPKGKLITLCVAANPWGGNTGWQGQYDYAALGQLADWIFIMTYDESYPGGQPGPVASYKFIENSVKYGLSKVPKEKLMAGVPFYGRYWKAESGGKPAILGNAFTVSDIEQLVANHASVTWYDATNECARAELTITAEDVTNGLWGGKKLDAGVYDIWYENPQSYEKKLSLARQYGLRGFGAWALGQEPDSLWTEYGIWLNGLPFTDIRLHWARDHILTLHELGLVKGRTTQLYAPEGNLTRLEAATLIARLLGLEGEPLFACIDRGILTGYPDGELRVANPVTRAELCVMLDRILHAPESLDFNESIYHDVSPASLPWCNNAIVSLSVHGALNGYPNGKFYPSRLVTRAEAAKILDIIRLLPLKTPDATPQARSLLIEGGPVIEPR